MADNEKEFLRKIVALTRRRFRGDWEMMFNHYSRKRGQTGHLDSDELGELLKDADIGNFATRSAWANGVVSILDTDRDRFISYLELKQYVSTHTPG
jgi:hypothetical protein